MLGALHLLLYCGVALWLLTAVGNWACQMLLSLTGLKAAITAAGNDVLPVGRIIGWLERLVMAAGLLCRSWEVLAAVIALKTLARFKELDHKLPAEYFLVGSLFSLFWTMAVCGGWLVYDHRFGFDLRAQAAVLMTVPDGKGAR